MSVRAAVVAGAVGAAVLPGGCGGSSARGSVTHAKAPATSSKVAIRSESKPSELAFSKCMRAHGVPNYPDPTSPGKIPLTTQTVRSGGFTADPNSPAYQAASNDCKSLAVATRVSPAQQARVMSAQLKFSVCMRANGVPNFPDPTSNGEIGSNGAISGVDPNSPAVQSAEKKCSKVLPLPGGLPGG